MTFRNSRLRDLYQSPDEWIHAIAERLDDPRQINIDFTQASAATGSAAWAPGRKVRILAIRLVNGDVAIAASTNTTALDIDVFDAPGTGKEADLTGKLATVAVAAKVALTLTLSSTDADRIIEADETLQVIRTIASTQGEMALTIDFRYED